MNHRGRTSLPQPGTWTNTQCSAWSAYSSYDLPLQIQSEIAGTFSRNLGETILGLGQPLAKKILNSMICRLESRYGTQYTRISSRANTAGSKSNRTPYD